MNYDKYIHTLASLSHVQLVVEVSVRLHAFNKAEELRRPHDEVEDCRRRYTLAERELAKRGEPRR